MSAARPGARLALVAALAAASLAGALLTGAAGLDAATVARALAGAGDPAAVAIVRELRLPRALAAFAVGGLLGLAGALMQALLRNPLAEPYVLGVSGGASAAALGALLLGLPAAWSAPAAFAGALLTMALVFGLAGGPRATPALLLLTGVAVAMGWGAVVAFLLSLAPAERLPGMLFWLMGDLGHVPAPGPALAVLALGAALALALAPALDALGLGRLRAAVAGVPVAATEAALYVLASLLAAVAVSTAGAVGFVGLLVPHAMRLLGLRRHRWLLPGAALAGGALLAAADTLARGLAAPRELPVGVVTALLGVPVFLVLLRRHGTGHG